MMHLLCPTAIVTLLIGWLPCYSFAQQEFNYDESKVPNYKLPDPLTLENGNAVTDPATWRDVRRPEILSLFQEHMYGKSPGAPQDMSFEVTSVDDNAFGGKAVRKEISVYFTDKKANGPMMDILVYLPARATRPAPTFVGLNFSGNHSITSDTSVTLSKQWMRQNDSKGIANNRATERSRGTSASRWPIDKILDRGYGVATIYCGDLDPDFHDGYQNGVHPLFYEEGQTRPAANQWATIGAWAWGLSRAMDYFEKDDDIDQERVAVLGHSRLGKTSLWAGAQDERFAIVISNNSGCGGAALSRRRFGETVARINAAFPHWFCDNFKKYNNNEDALPIDQHMLIALMAPRPVYIASAEEDRWADPRGEFLSAKHADPVYKLLGTKGLGVEQMPAVNEPVMNAIGYHIRTGKHDVTDFDWQCYLDFADQAFGRK